MGTFRLLISCSAVRSRAFPSNGQFLLPELVKDFLIPTRLYFKFRETNDYVSEPQTSLMRIVPDGAFILKNHETDNTGLFFLEVDMGTERLTSWTNPR
jgi:hypothetical protein